MTTLSCDLVARRGDFSVSAAIEAEDREVIAVVGPNGAGKSTLLRALAGLHAASGRVVVGGTDITRQPAHRRPVAWVPQDGALFPHLTALDNVAFGVGRRPGRAVAQAWLDRLDVGNLAGRKPHQLSGGQAQKVALARALARQPRLLLLDEPLAALDATARAEVRRTMREHLASFAGATLIVTHDPIDAVSIATRLLALADGAVVQDAAVAEATRAPRSAWLADLFGANAFTGRLRRGVLQLADHSSLITADEGDADEALAVVPAHAVTLHLDRPAGSARNAWPVVIEQLTTLGGRVRVHATGAPPVVAEITHEAVAELQLREQTRVWASVKATEVTVVRL